MSGYADESKGMQKDVGVGRDGAIFFLFEESLCFVLLIVS